MTDTHITDASLRQPRRPTGAYTVAMIAERWGTSDTFVYDQIHAGRLEAFKLGGKLIRVRPEALDEYEQRAVILAAQPEPVPALPTREANTIARLIRAA